MREHEFVFEVAACTGGEESGGQEVKAMPTESPFLSIAECAAYFRVSETTIRNARGDFAGIAHVHTGKRHLVTRESVEEVAARMLSRAKSVEGSVEAALGRARKKKSRLKVA